MKFNVIFDVIPGSVRLFLYFVLSVLITDQYPVSLNKFMEMKNHENINSYNYNYYHYNNSIINRPSSSFSNLINNYMINQKT